MILLVVIVLGTTGASQDDFTVFLRRFLRSSEFRKSHTAAPLPFVLGGDCDEPEQRGKWPAAAAAKNVIVPLDRGQLNAQGLSQQIMEVSADEVKVFQFREEADSYRVTYRFRRIRGRWLLVGYEDTSC